MIRFVPSSDIPVEEKKDYSLFKTELDGRRFRMEFTPIGDFKMCYEDDSLSSFKLKLPPLPTWVHFVCFFFFKEICNVYNTEAALQLFWDDEEGKYFLHLPKQQVGHSWVNFERDCLLESQYWLVADIHSHGRIKTFFSSVDDADELGTRIYGVYGDLKSNRPSCLYRAGSGGLFTSLTKEELYQQDDEVCLSEVNEEVGRLLNEVSDKFLNL